MSTIAQEEQQEKYYEPENEIIAAEQSTNKAFILRQTNHTFHVY